MIYNQHDWGYEFRIKQKDELILRELIDVWNPSVYFNSFTMDSKSLKGIAEGKLSIVYLNDRASWLIVYGTINLNLSRFKRGILNIGNRSKFEIEIDIWINSIASTITSED